MEISESKIIFVDLNLLISDITDLKRVFEDKINPTCTCGTKIRTNSHFCCIVSLNKIIDTDSSLLNPEDSNATRNRTFFSRNTIRTDKISTCFLNRIHFIN